MRTPCGQARRWCRFVALLLVVAALSPIACRKQPQFGWDFEHEAILDDFAWKCRTLYRLSPDYATSGTKSLEILFHPAPAGSAGNYPGVSFSGFDPDWTRYQALAFDVHNPEDSPLGLTLRIDDRDTPDYSDRLNRQLLLPPGQNRILIPFSEFITSGTKRKLDFRMIQTVMVFLANPSERHTLYLDRVRLE